MDMLYVEETSLSQLRNTLASPCFFEVKEGSAGLEGRAKEPPSTLRKKGSSDMHCTSAGRGGGGQRSNLRHPKYTLSDSFFFNPLPPRSPEKHVVVHRHIPRMFCDD